MPFLEASDGIRLYYELEGEGPPLLLHLGAGCDLELWRAAGHVAALASYRIADKGHTNGFLDSTFVAPHVRRFLAG